METQTFSNRHDLDQALTTHVSDRLAEAVRERGKALMVVSGGSTPLNFFGLLSQTELPWSKITVVLADERWVPLTDSDSNEQMVKDRLLIHHAANANYVSLKSAAETPYAGEREISERIGALGKFDVVILGMGADGHTASLFPGSAELADGLKMDSPKSAIAVTPLTAAHQRISMTLPRLLNSDEIILHITGESKLAVFVQARLHNNPPKFPIAAVVNQQSTPVTLYYAP